MARKVDVTRDGLYRRLTVTAKRIRQDSAMMRDYSTNLRDLAQATEIERCAGEMRRAAVLMRDWARRLLGQQQGGENGD